jgi:enolase
MSNITKIKAREILDSRGNPTIEVNIFTGESMSSAEVPSGASTGTFEACELRDGGFRYLGKGVQKAVRHVEKKIAPLLTQKDCTLQKEIDTLMIEGDGTKSKKKWGANAILAVSLAVARAGAESNNLPLYSYLNELLTQNKKKVLPRPFCNIINGGKHADSSLSFQEFMIVPNLGSFKENIRAASEVYHTLKQELHKKYGAGSTNVGDEGGFALKQLKNAEHVLDLLVKVIKDTGYKSKVGLALDCAASECYKNGKYVIDGKKMSKDQLLNYYLKLIKKYPLVSIEDPFEQNDFASFAELTRRSGIQIVGDDLTVTNPERIRLAIENKSCNCLLLKVNQIGTLSEALEAVQLAYKAGWKVMVSHRSGETEDPFIADLAVGIGCGMIKAGAPCRGERTAKYNQLLRIEEELKGR